MGLVNLSSRSLVRIGGEGAQKLLNDTLSGTIDETLAGVGRWYALLSPQGKILAEGLVTFHDEAFWLDLDATGTAEFVRRMKMYRLRAKATIDDLSASHGLLWAEATSDLPSDSLVYRDARFEGLGWRAIVSRDAAGDMDDRDDPWRGARINAGIAELGPDFPADSTFPHDVGMDLLGGVDFKKGCYIGQEVVSRMQHRGTARRRPVIVSGDGLAAGVPVFAGSRAAGDMGTVVDRRGLAILRIDRITDPAAVTVADARAGVALPGWATYRFGESAEAD